MITISIWLYILSLMAATSLGIVIMCLCNVASDTERAFVSERRALDLAIALRELLGTVRAAQAGLCNDVHELDDALERADDVLANRTADREDREVRTLVLRMALRRLLAAVQYHIEQDDGMQELAGAMSHAAEVL